MSTGHLRPISLEELVDAAELLHRVDRKYVVPRRELPGLLAEVPSSARVLEIGGRRELAYRSVYLDTRDLAAFRLAGTRRRRRFKVRTRSYLDTGGCWLEVKTRGARGTTVKQRIPHPDAELADGLAAGAASLTAQGRLFVDRCLADARVAGVRAADLRPVLATAYRRTTVYLPQSHARVTIDVDLGWTTLSAAGAGDLDRGGLAIVETKSGATPSEMDRLLWAHGHRPVRLSKYGAGLAALRPDLPRLKWHRVLAGALAAEHQHEHAHPNEDREPTGQTCRRVA